MLAPRAVARRSSLLPEVHVPHHGALGGLREAAVDVGHSAQAGAEQAQAHNRSYHHRQTLHRGEIRDRPTPPHGSRPNQRSDMAPPVSSSSPAPAANAAVTSRCSSRVAT